ncbi:hypothetical protein HELRODRAFT_159360 [Helobdella robusta]|uniref:SCP domain-containing protein n=1 Tax=Helobdella robusta TaxID=6412 RepID=T1ENX7_HELRO|nr:hypothetical protein HELRODRAFT_159360 [Helobdella robusta]ESO12775.1 hypothetical protein HELRODRAFT_159360 [Helobdella robusta]
MARIVSSGFVALLMIALTDSTVYMEDEHEIDFLDFLVNSFNSRKSHSNSDPKLSEEADKIADGCSVSKGLYELNGENLTVTSFSRSSNLKQAYYGWAIDFFIAQLCKKNYCLLPTDSYYGGNKFDVGCAHNDKCKGLKAFVVCLWRDRKMDFYKEVLSQPN